MPCDAKQKLTYSSSGGTFSESETVRAASEKLTRKPPKEQEAPKKGNYFS